MKRNWTTLKNILATYDHRDGLCLTLLDKEGKIICANANMVRTLHIRNPRIENVSFFDFLHPTHYNCFKAAIRKSTRNKIKSGMELYLKNGIYHPMKWDINFVNETGESPVFLCVGQRILDEKKVVESLWSRLQERETMLNEFMTNTPNMSWVVDEKGQLVFASLSFYDFFELDPETSQHKKVVDLLPVAASRSLYTKHAEAFDSGRPIEFIEKVQWANGINHVFHINLFPIKSAGDKKMLGGSAVDLSGKYEAEKKLQELNNRMLLLSKATSDAIWEWDMQTGQIYRNEALMEMIGYTNESPKGLSWWLRRIHPEDRNRVSDKVKENTEMNLHSWQDQYRFKCADGEYKHMQDKGFIVYENELPVKMIGSLQDISNLKELEEKLVEERVQRQQEISETVIRVQEKERTRIGHELHDNVNQILSTAKLYMDMLKPAGKQDKQYKEKVTEYLLLAIEEIRKLSKELVVPQLTQKGLIESIFQLIDDVELTTRIKIKFTHDHENDLLSPGKKVTLFRIVQEQLKNIIKHSKARQVDILLQRKNNIAELIIRDDGIGFNSSQTHRGIGLSNIYERTRFYNGTVDIETLEGKGCTLRVNIPSN